MATIPNTIAASSATDGKEEVEPVAPSGNGGDVGGDVGGKSDGDHGDSNGNGDDTDGEGDGDEDGDDGDGQAQTPPSNGCARELPIGIEVRARWKGDRREYDAIVQGFNSDGIST